MKQYAVIHAVAGLFEGYSDTTCEFFPKRGFADKHIKQILDDYRKDKMCVNILTDIHDDETTVTMTRQYKDYHACVSGKNMDHDDWVAENGDDVSVEVFKVIELDMSNRSDSTESCWLTWNQIEATQAWDYYPLCMSLVARVSSDVMDNMVYEREAQHNLEQLTEFISAVYYRNHAFIDMDDYTMHAFRIPKPKNSDSYDPLMEEGKDLKKWMDANISFES